MAIKHWIADPIFDFINDRTPIVIHVEELNETLKHESANVRYTHRSVLKPSVRYAQRVERPQTRLRILLISDQPRCLVLAYRCYASYTLVDVRLYLLSQILYTIYIGLLQRCLLRALTR